MCMKCVYSMVCGIRTYMWLWLQLVWGGVCTNCLLYLTSWLPALTAVTCSVTQSFPLEGRKMRPWRWLGTLKAAVLHLLVRKTFNK